MITFAQSGSFDSTERFLKASSDTRQVTDILKRYGDEGVRTLSAATPVDTDETAQSWYYTIESKRGQYSIVWRNKHVVSGQVIAILIQYGHGTGTGGYVQGRDYINPAIQPIMDRIATDAWRELSK